jgi:hypothetical protein
MMGKSADGEAKLASTHPLFQLSIISNTTPKNALYQEPLHEHHFWALFRGPRHKFCKARLPKAYHARKRTFDLEKQKLVACYFLQPHFIDLAE